MQEKTAIYKQKLWEFYSVTGIPVALVTDINNFELLYPQAPDPHTLKNHAKYLQNIIDDIRLPIHVPIIKHVHLSCFYSIIRLEDEVFIQIGPVASHDINIKKYISNLQQEFPASAVVHHMNIVQGAPKVDLNYFINCVILATHFICDKEISKSDILFDEGLTNGNITYSEKFIDRTSTSVDQLSFEDEIYHVVREGNVRRLKELQSNNSLSSFYFFQENDLHFLRIAFIFYGAIVCHYATLGGLSGNSVKRLFRQYLTDMSNLTEPKYFWQLLPKFSSTLCQKVHDKNNPKTTSEIVNKCRKYIENNIYSKITLSDLEKCSHATRKTILRHFTEYLGTTPSEYIIDAKLKEVAYVLEESDLDILEISIMFGYSSQSHLNRLFTQKYGCTPFKYRQKLHRNGVG